VRIREIVQRGAGRLRPREVDAEDRGLERERRLRVVQDKRCESARARADRRILLRAAQGGGKQNRRSNRHTTHRHDHEGNQNKSPEAEHKPLPNHKRLAYVQGS